MLKPSLELDRTRLPLELHNFVSRELPQRRTELIREIARRVLREAIRRTPVDSGEARSAWVAALEQLGGSPPPGWEGRTPDPSSIASGRQSATVQTREQSSTTELEVTSAVPHITFLEYGTRSQPATSAVRDSLEAIRHEIAAEAFLP